MTPEKLAGELMCCVTRDGGWDRGRASKMIREAIAAERERCARVAESINPLATDDDPKSVFLLIEEIASSIRSQREGE
jgi:hypothetical protein